MKIRTITTGVPRPFSSESLQRAATFNDACRAHFEANGYDVQSTRVSCQIWEEPRDVAEILALESEARGLGIEFLSLGTILPGNRHTETHIARVADVIVESQTLFATVTLTTPEGQGASEIAARTAAIIR